MRKRSEARQTEIPGTQAPAAPKSEPKSKDLTAGTSIENGIVFVTCPDCSLKASVGSAKRDGDTRLCIRCGADITALILFEEREKQRVAIPGEDVCETCGVALTKTAIGKFYPCGHDKRASQTPTPDAIPPRKYDRAGETEGVPPHRVLEPDPRIKRTGPPLPSAAELAAKMKAAGEKNPEEAPKRERAENVLHSTIEAVDTLTVVYGKQTFTPRPFNTFEVGPFTWQTNVLPGETPEAALERAEGYLAEFAEAEFKRKALDFLTRLAWITEQVGEKR